VVSTFNHGEDINPELQVKECQHQACPGAHAKQTCRAVCYLQAVHNDVRNTAHGVHIMRV
jgi:hypothetical protein